MRNLDPEQIRLVLDMRQPKSENTDVLPFPLDVPEHLQKWFGKVVDGELHPVEPPDPRNN